MKYDKIEETKDGDSDQEVIEGFLSSEAPAASKPQRVSRVLWFVIAEHVLVALALVVLWKTLVPAHTNLQYQTRTADNKTYPSGPLSWSQTFNALPCGKTPEEARARGCEFDMLVTAWLPPRCIDRGLVNEFLELGNWDFYTRWHATEKNKFGTYDPDFIGSANKTVWTTRSWHVMHCLYMFKKLNRAIVNGWTVDAETVSEPHTEHCMNVLIEQVLSGHTLDMDEIETYLEIIYPPC